MTVSGGSPVLAADINEALNRRIGKTESQSDGTSFTSAETVDLTLTVNLKAGRTYEVYAYAPYASTVLGDNGFIRIRLGTTTAGAQLTYDRIRFDSASGVYVGKPSYEYTATVDGDVTFCTTGGRATGTGTLTPKGAASQPRYLAVRLQTTQ